MDEFHQIKYITEQLIEKGNFSIVDSAFSADYVAHAGDKTHKGHKFIKQFTKQLRTAIPDIKIEKIELISQADNVLSWQRTLSGIHKANLKGIPATHKKVKWYEIVVSRFDKDKIVEEWVASDLALQLMLKQQ
ncbi:MAG TPA: ester cyclase [Bacteroidales bacterium]|nr:ester cyclase [Bacteroidales bacterium]HRZ49273.1 ester cyclase [Bacteroidales bacterium]